MPVSDLRTTARDWAARLGDARLRVLRHVAGAADPVTVREAAEILGGHPNNARTHLAALAAEGLVERGPLPRVGRGRPSIGYAVTAAGRSALDSSTTALAGVAVAEEAGLLAALGQHLADRDEPEVEARSVGRAWGVRLAAQFLAETTERPAETSGASRDKVRNLLAGLGFSPSVESADESAEVISLRTCPLLAEAKENPGVVCQVHQGLVAGALSVMGAEDQTVELEPFAVPGACLLTLRSA